jgi:hypothetical protein
MGFWVKKGEKGNKFGFTVRVVGSHDFFFFLAYVSILNK